MEEISKNKKCSVHIYIYKVIIEKIAIYQSHNNNKQIFLKCFINFITTILTTKDEYKVMSINKYILLSKFLYFYSYFCSCKTCIKLLLEREGVDRGSSRVLGKPL